MDTGSIDWHDIEQALALGEQGAIQRVRYRAPLITDLARDMGWMQCFQKKRRKCEEDPEEDLQEVMSDRYSTTPIRRTAPKVGRNEPCPCGSGKKFKKCCASG